MSGTWRLVGATAAVGAFLALPIGRAHAQVVVPSEPVPFDAEEPADDPGPPPALPILAEIVQAESTPIWLPSLQGFYGVSFLRYNRTDGLIPAWGARLEPSNPATTPRVRARIGTATTRQRTYWEVRVDQQLPTPGAVSAGFAHFNRPTSFDTWRISGAENDLSTFIAGNDLLDWWREEGWTTSVNGETPGGRFAGSVAFLSAEHRSLQNRSPFVLFGGDDFRPNPRIDEGRLHSLSATLRFEGRDVQSPLLPTPGWRVEAEWERGGGLLGGDIDFVLGRLDVRNYNRFGRDTWLDWRLLWIGALTDRGTPPQRRVRLGGPGSLRGFPSATFEGDEALQLSTELRLPLPVNRRIALLFLTWHIVGLADVGFVDDYGDPHANLGVGISGINLFSYLGLFVAQRVTDLDRPDDGPRFIVRLRRDF